MLSLSIPIKIFLSFIIGAIIGLERESYDRSVNKKSKNEGTHEVGVRTFSLITILGALTGFILEVHPAFSLLVAASFMIITISYYIISSIVTRDIGITTDLALIMAYLLGFFVVIELFPIQLILAITVILILILARKQDIRNIISYVQREELNAFISYALIAIVILPFLPNQTYSISHIPGAVKVLEAYGFHVGKFAEVGLFNPFSLWFIVALITGVDMAGYLLERIVGNKHGRLLASAVGGFISSTATTQSLAQESKSTDKVNQLVTAAIFANLVSFIPIFILIASINTQLLVFVTPILFVMVVSAFCVGIFFLKKGEKHTILDRDDTPKKVTESQIFELVPALKFAFFFLIVRITTQYALIFFGESGFFIATAIASLTGVDAAVINLSQLTGQTVTMATAVKTIVLINAVNLIAKSVYSFLQGRREFAYKFAAGMSVIIVSTLITLLFI